LTNKRHFAILTTLKQRQKGSKMMKYTQNQSDQPYQISLTLCGMDDEDHGIQWIATMWYHNNGTTLCDAYHSFGYNNYGLATMKKTLRDRERFDRVSHQMLQQIQQRLPDSDIVDIPIEIGLDDYHVGFSIPQRRELDRCLATLCEKETV
jgi:hypothetical protein